MVRRITNLVWELKGDRAGEKALLTVSESLRPCARKGLKESGTIISARPLSDILPAHLKLFSLLMKPLCSRANTIKTSLQATLFWMVTFPD